MIKHFFMILILLLFSACSITTRTDERALHELNSPPKEINRIRVIKKDDNHYLGLYNGTNCWANTETLNCKLKKAHTLIDRFNHSLEGLEGAVGGCCTNTY